MNNNPTEEAFMCEIEKYFNGELVSDELNFLVALAIMELEINIFSKFLLTREEKNRITKFLCSLTEIEINKYKEHISNKLEK